MNRKMMTIQNLPTQVINRKADIPQQQLKKYLGMMDQVNTSRKQLKLLLIMDQVMTNQISLMTDLDIPVILVKEIQENQPNPTRNIQINQGKLPLAASLSHFIQVLVQIGVILVDLVLEDLVDTQNTQVEEALVHSQILLSKTFHHPMTPMMILVH
jgi:hypothetical protein